MTEKRFTLIDMNNIEWKLISPIKDNGRDLTIKQVDELLNELHDENEQLKQGIDKLFDYFAKWFEEERGVYIEDFVELWKSIQKGDVE